MDMGTERRWELHWIEDARRVPGFPHDDGDEVELWARPRDPARLKAFARGEGWPEDKVVRMALSTGAGSDADRLDVACTAGNLLGWDPAIADLPSGGEPTPRARNAAGLKLEMLSGIRKAVERGVEDGVIARREADGLLLHAAQVADRRRDAR